LLDEFRDLVFSPITTNIIPSAPYGGLSTLPHHLSKNSTIKVSFLFSVVFQKPPLKLSLSDMDLKNMADFPKCLIFQTFDLSYYLFSKTHNHQRQH
jgi:hypothetical protein